MTIRDYIGQKFSAYGDSSEADMLDFSIKSGLSPDDEMSRESIGKVETGMIGSSRRCCCARIASARVDSLSLGTGRPPAVLFVPVRTERC